MSCNSFRFLCPADSSAWPASLSTKSFLSRFTLLFTSLLASVYRRCASVLAALVLLLFTVAFLCFRSATLPKVSLLPFCYPPQGFSASFLLPSPRFLCFLSATLPKVSLLPFCYPPQGFSASVLLPSPRFLCFRSATLPKVSAEIQSFCFLFSYRESCHKFLSMLVPLLRRLQ